MLKLKELCVKIDLRKVVTLINFPICFIFMFYLYKSIKCIFTHYFFIKMYAHNKKICLKLRNICFSKFTDSRKITSQVIKFASRFAKCEARILTLASYWQFVCQKFQKYEIIKRYFWAILWPFLDLNSKTVSCTRIFSSLIL